MDEREWTVTPVREGAGSAPSLAWFTALAVGVFGWLLAHALTYWLAQRSASADQDGAARHTHQCSLSLAIAAGGLAVAFLLALAPVGAALGVLFLGLGLHALAGAVTLLVWLGFADGVRPLIRVMIIGVTIPPTPHRRRARRRHHDRQQIWAFPIIGRAPPEAVA